MSSMGTCYNLGYLGCTPISKYTSGFNVLQKPLHDLYVSYLTPKGMRQPAVSRLALTDRGIILTVQGNDSFYSMRDVLLWEAVHWVRVQTKDKKFLAAFEPIDPDRHRGKDSLFSKLDSQHKYLTKLNHEPLLACLMRRTSGPKTIDVHAFVCSSEEQVLHIVASIGRVQQLFQSQDQPASVRLPSGNPASHAANANGFRSQRQAKPNERGDGEITLEELLRLADMAITDPMKGPAAAEAAKEAPPFKMGESWTSKESQHGVRRSKTFNEGQPRSAAAGSRVADPARRQSNAKTGQQMPVDAPRGGMAGGAVAWQQLQDARYYENISAPNGGQQRTYENLGANGLFPSDGYGIERSPVPQPRLHQHPQQQQQPMLVTHGSLDERDSARMIGQQELADLKRRKSTPPESLRMVIAESKLASSRNSVYPGADQGITQSAFNLSTPGDPRAPPIVDVYFDQPIQANHTPKPVAMVQPRKVSGVKVLPEPGLEVVQLHKVSQQPKGEQAKKEQYQKGDGANRNFTKSMYELNNIEGAKPTTPQVRKKFTDPTPDPAIKFTAPDPNPAIRFTTPGLNPAIKFTNPDPGVRFTNPDPNPGVRFTNPDPNPPVRFTNPDPNPGVRFTNPDPNPGVRFTNPDPNPPVRFTNPDPNPARKFTSAEHSEAGRKSSNPEVVKENKSTEKPSGERGQKDAEIEAFAMNVNFYKPPTNTLSPHGTNFESALGYFP